MAAPISLQITIVGAGLGGLAAATCLAQRGHQVQVIESNNGLSELGAGIQVPPNAMRILDSWGLKSILYQEGNASGGATVRRYEDGKVIGIYRGNAKELYGYHAIVIHRADLQRIFYDAAVKAGAQIRFESKVVSADTSTSTLILEDGSAVMADLVVGADGIGSTIRSMVFPDDSFQPRKTPDCAVRVILSKSAMERDPQLARMAKTPGADIWLGPRRHVITYNIRGMELLNVVICGPGSASVGVWNEPANLEDVKREYADFEPTIRSILNCADDCHKWMIAEVPDLPGWSSPSGKVVLLGDAAHAMMPYAAQGAAQTIEDAAVLGECLSRARSAVDIPSFVKAYETIRKPRAERVKAISLGNSKEYAYPDGPEQEARDKLYGQSLTAPKNGEKRQGVPTADSTAAFATQEFSMWLFGYDVANDVRRYFGTVAS